MKNALPFVLVKRPDRPFYFVSFKNERTGEYLPRISTKQRTKADAMKTALSWYSNGIPQKEQVIGVSDFSLLNMAKKSDISPKETELILNELKRKGLIKSAVITGSKQDIPLEQFLLDFWTFDISPYVKEKLRKNHGIARRHVEKQYCYIKNYWIPFFKGRLLGDITKRDINDFITTLEESPLSFGAKNDIIRAGTTGMKWAYEKELIDSNVTTGLTFFSGKYNERQILTPELAQAVFSIPWQDERAKLANMLAMVTGLRAGEIQGLRVQDLGKDCLYIRHSWNLSDGLKCTKNRESRIVEVPFPGIMQGLLALAKSNPHKQGMNGFIFYSDRVHSPKKHKTEIPYKPIESDTFLKGLRTALHEIGMSEAEAYKITFHGWRHYFTAYMNERVTEKLLMQQTGHKTVIMMEHYAEHRLTSDKATVQSAQIEAFGNILKPKEKPAQRLIEVV